MNWFKKNWDLQLAGIALLLPLSLLFRNQSIELNTYTTYLDSNCTLGQTNQAYTEQGKKTFKVYRKTKSHCFFNEHLEAQGNYLSKDCVFPIGNPNATECNIKAKGNVLAEKSLQF